MNPENADTDVAAKTAAPSAPATTSTKSAAKSVDKVEDVASAFDDLFNN